MLRFDISGELMLSKGDLEQPLVEEYGSMRYVSTRETYKSAASKSDSCSISTKRPLGF